MDSIVQNVVDALTLGSLYALLGLGIALVFGIMQLVNFAHAELLMFGGYALFVTAALAWPLSMAISIIFVILLALTMERVAFRGIRGANPATGLITAFAVSFLLQNVAILVFGGRPKTVALPEVLSESFVLGNIRVAKLNVLVVGLTILLLGVLGAFLKRTNLGIQMRAAAEDFEMARLLGVRADVVIATAFAMSGFLAGVAAIILVAQTGTLTPTMGILPVLMAFAVTILGGLGSLTGAVLAGFVLGGLQATFQIVLPLDIRPYRDAFVFSFVILILLVRPQGLIVVRSARGQI